MRKGYENIEKDVDDYFFWLKNTEEKDIRSSRERALCILRLITQKGFKEDIEAFRKEINLPPKEKLDEELTGYSTSDWTDDNPDAPQWYTDERIVDLCKKYQLDVARYQEFVWSYLYYGGCYPFLPFDMMHTITPDEARYKARLELLKDGRDMPKAAYIRFYQDTSINQLINFIEANKNTIKIYQKGLTKYPIKYSHHMGTFKQHLSIYLYYLQGKTDKEIRDIAEDKLKLRIDEDRVRKIISDMKKLISQSSTADFLSLEYLDKALQ